MSGIQGMGRGGIKGLPPVVLNLIIINALVLAISFLFKDKLDFFNLLGLHYITSDFFKSWQFVSYMFMHGDFTHLLFNMFALWMFGSILEKVWGPKRFLTYYMITGIGAGIVQLVVAFFRIQSIEAMLSPEQIYMVYNVVPDLWSDAVIKTQASADTMISLYWAINGSTVGASGAVFGILLAFGMMFPNSMIYVFFAIPVKAKYFVMIYGAIELYMGVSGTQDGIAHYAHLGGMLFGFFLIRYWKKKGVY